MRYEWRVDYKSYYYDSHKKINLTSVSYFFYTKEAAKQWIKNIKKKNTNIESNVDFKIIELHPEKLECDFTFHYYE